MENHHVDDLLFALKDKGVSINGSPRAVDLLQLSAAPLFIMNELVSDMVSIHVIVKKALNERTHVEMSYNSRNGGRDGGRADGSRGGGSDHKCYECGEPGRFTRAW
uniref:Uncharacterized protein n=1 Tax=Tanacetum cinerariifolium TaxID=118510 RepID=A0A699GTV6_TANCI|nr:hypothetical protein [Tanacetum cinerariifolium]